MRRAALPSGTASISPRDSADHRALEHLGRSNAARRTHPLPSARIADVRMLLITCHADGNYATRPGRQSTK